MYKIALIGDGKTGGKLLQLIKENAKEFTLVGPFNSDYLPKDHKEELATADLIFSFVPGTAASELISLLLQLKKMVVWGSTGVAWPSDLNQTLRSLNLKWLWANNFSLGMNIIKNILQDIPKSIHLLQNVKMSIEETHHIHKKDAPSGTALRWKEWVSAHDDAHCNKEQQIEIVSYREGEVLGQHKLLLETPFEKIEICHTTKDRMLFAEGALWAGRQLLFNKNLQPGFIAFEDLGPAQK